jgi:hypothetical protein
MLKLILFAFAFVCYCIAAAPIAEPFRLRLVAAGSAFFVAAFIFGDGAALVGWSH